MREGGGDEVFERAFLAVAVARGGLDAFRPLFVDQLVENRLRAGQTIGVLAQAREFVVSRLGPIKLKDAGIDADSIKDNAVNIIIATVMGVIAFAE